MTFAKGLGNGVAIGGVAARPELMHAAPANSISTVAVRNAGHEVALRRGLLIGKGGLYGNVLRLSPPMTLTETELDEALTILADVLTAVDNSTAVSPAQRTHPRAE